MSSMQEKEIFGHLKDLGCCGGCCLRYLCDRSIDYSDIDSVIKQRQLCETINDEEISAKKQKINPCTVCLGLLQEPAIDAIINHHGIEKVKEYDSEVFTVSISMPASILLREHSMRLHLEDKYPAFYNDDNTEIPLNRAWKMFVRNRISDLIGKEFQNSDVCDFSINVNTEYASDEDELSVLKKMQPKLFETRMTQHRKYSGELFSRKGVLTALQLTHSGVFKMYGDVPPEIPSSPVTCKSIECSHNCVYLAGRYCKFSRNLSQSPWIIDGVKTMETSVQEIIFSNMADILGIPEQCLKFSSSGREDCDVRCLGRGRPFYVEIANPKRTKFTFDEFRILEKAINKADLINVTDLQHVKRSDLCRIKEGEESKTKQYIALCVTKTAVTEDMISSINKYGSCEISQKTPVRVLHRRPLAVRTKMIEEMKAVAIPGHSRCFELHVLTQAGTYIKEFVHGDFGRTKPNIGEIIGTEVDIAALDVVAINLDWPEPVNYTKQ